jgi:hypothetical protein
MRPAFSIRRNASRTVRFGEFIDMARRVDGAAGAAAIQAFWVTGAWAAMFVPEGD